MNESRFIVRRVDATDPAVWARIVAMDAQCFNKNEAPALADNSGAWWIARCESQDAGYCSIKPSATTPDAGYMSRAGVLPKFRGRGLQKLMIRRRIAYAKAERWKLVLTDTCNNVVSSNSLIACGFRMFEPAKKWSFEHACYWIKFLAP